MIVAAKYYDKYIDRVKHQPLVDALRVHGTEFIDFLKDIPDSAWDYAYAEGKWTIKQVVLHVCDIERVMAYRALTFGRGDKQGLPSIDQDVFAKGAEGVASRSPKSLIKEFKALRKASISLFKYFDNEALSRVGVASGKDVSVLALGYIIAGHSIHHQEVIGERYLQVAQ
jgi:hypothetical protein